MNEHEQRIYNKLMRFSKSTLFEMAREACLPAPRGYCWVEGGETRCIIPGWWPYIQGASQDDAARALANWFSQE